MYQKVRYPRLLLVTLITALLAGCGNPEPTSPADHFRDYGYDPAQLPAVLTEEAFPGGEPWSAERITGFAGKDLTGKDLRWLSPSFLASFTFDQATLWPSKAMLPAEFTPEQWLETAKDPGLSIGSLHRQGIDGRGVAVAVFDKPILSTHLEFAGRIVYRHVEPDSRKNQLRHFHGIAVASILAGKTTGVAPGAELYYFACPDDGKNFLHYTKALKQVLELNRSLPAAERIRLVNISDGIEPDSKYRPDWEAALAQAADAGVAVIYANNPDLEPYRMGGCLPYLDRNNPANFRLSLAVTGAPPQSVIIPSDYRTTAMNYGEDQYVYWGEGGFSWCMPYVSGLLALAWQANPDLTYRQAMWLLAATASDGSAAKVVNPQAFIAAVQAQ